MIYITTDTHFGHQMLIDQKIRPENYEEKINKGLLNLKDEDVLIHLGDFGFKILPDWSQYSFKKWLILGNHDKKSIHRFLNLGFDWVGYSMTIKVFGKWILLSHMPLPIAEYMTKSGLRKMDYNIHGHFHNSDHRIHDPVFNDIMSPQHILVSLELHGYNPIPLEVIIKKYQEGTWLLNQHSNL